MAFLHKARWDHQAAYDIVAEMLVSVAVMFVSLAQLHKINSEIRPMWAHVAVIQEGTSSICGDRGSP